MPGGTAVKVYNPSPEVLSVRAALVAVLVKVTAALGTPAPLGSVTRPEISPKVCPSRGSPKQRSNPRNHLVRMSNSPHPRIHCLHSQLREFLNRLESRAHKSPAANSCSRNITQKLQTPSN